MSNALSFEFLIWLVATVGLFAIAPTKTRRYLLILSTVYLLVVADHWSLISLTAMTVLVCAVTRISGYREPVALLAGCAVILAILVIYMFIDISPDSTTLTGGLIPLGLSYYSVRCIHLLMERYLERIRRPEIPDVVSYLFFPATIIAGPINRYADFVDQSTLKPTREQLATAFERILYGYVKIVVLSNFLLGTKLFPWLISLVDPMSAQYQYLDALEYGLTLYLLLSGYSDIAIGFALLLGHKVIENFSWPFLKSNIVEFWRSWLISLTSLVRDYVFTSVQAKTRGAGAAVFATMLVIGLWHGLSMNYLAWGLYHATGIVIYRAWAASSAALFLQAKLPVSVSKVLAWFLTFQFVILGFVFTKEDSFIGSWDAWMILLGGVLGYV